jgi:hypothetical protein
MKRFSPSKPSIFKKSPLFKTAFLSECCIKAYKGYNYLLCCDLKFSVDNCEYTIPTGFKTDLASIPRPIWPIISPAYSKLIRPAIIHDWNYSTSKNLYTRKQCDQIFYQMLIDEGLNRPTAWLIYYAVRSFAGVNYYKIRF